MRQLHRFSNTASPEVRLHFFNTVSRYNTSTFSETLVKFNAPLSPIEFEDPRPFNYEHKDEKDLLDDILSPYIESLNDDVDTPLEAILIEQSPTLISFFASQMIDIPKCFRKSKSMYTVSAAHPETRFINMLMRHGRRRYAAKLYKLSLHQLSTQHVLTSLDGSQIEDWRTFYEIFTQLRPMHLGTNPSNLQTSLVGPSFDIFKQAHDEDYALIDDNRWLYDLLFDELINYTPVFSFYIRKVDKMKRKHSRGKSGKYVISWKYVPLYKRLLVTLRWLVKDIRFRKSKTFRKRIETSIESLLFDSKSHLVSQTRRFVHKFVFQKYRKTLLRTLRSTS